MTYIFTNVLGTFVFDESLSLIDEKRFSSLEEFEKRESVEKQMKKKHKDSKVPSKKQLLDILGFFRSPEFQKDLRARNIQLTKIAIRDSINEDNTILAAINSINDLDKICNTMSKKLRHWFNLYLPELDHKLDDHETFAYLVHTKTKKELMKEFDITETMGADLSKKDVEEMKKFAKRITEMFQMRKDQETYLESIMKKYCPNIHALAGTMIGAKLFEHAKSLKRLAILPASTIQLLGAEKALFRHIKTGAPSPKHGVIITHPYLTKVKRRDRGQAARLLAGKLSIAARVDFFKGDFIADSMKKEIEKKLGLE